MNGPQMTFFGRLTRDPQELRYTANGGVAYTTVDVAVNTYRGREEEQDTHYFEVTLWRRQAESAMNRCRKGQQVYVAGQYSFREYTRRDGNQGYSHRVDARDFQYFTEPGRETTLDTEAAKLDAAEQPAATEPAPEPVAADGAEPFGDAAAGLADPFGADFDSNDLDSMEY